MDESVFLLYRDAEDPYSDEGDEFLGVFATKVAMDSHMSRIIKDEQAAHDLDNQARIRLNQKVIKFKVPKFYHNGPFPVYR